MGVSGGSDLRLPLRALLFISSYWLWNPWCCCHFFSSQPRTTCSFQKWKLSRSVPHALDRHGTAVSFSLITFWRSYKSPSDYAFIFGALFSDWFNTEKHFLLVHGAYFPVWMLLKHVCMHMCMCARTLTFLLLEKSVQDHGKTISKLWISCF